MANVDPVRWSAFDMTWYQLAAGQLVSGEGITRPGGVPTAAWPPGYPLLLALAYELGGIRAASGQILNLLLSALTIGFVYLQGRWLFGVRAGLLAAALVALLPGDILFSPLLLSEIAFGAALTGATALLVRSAGAKGSVSLPASFAFGVALGAAALVRAVALAFLAVPFVFWLLRGATGRTTVRSLSIAMLGMLCAVLPWSVRNWVALGTPVITTSLGQTLAHANPPGDAPAEGLAYRIELRQRFSHLAYPEREVATDRAFQREATRRILDRPTSLITLLPSRLAELYGHDHAALDWGRPRSAPEDEPAGLVSWAGDTAVTRVADGAFLLLLLAAFSGGIVCLRHGDRRAILPWLSILYFTLLHTTLFPSHPRYHHPVSPYLALSAAALAARRPTTPREGSGR